MEAELEAVDDTRGPSTINYAFPNHTRTSCTNNDNLPRQQKYNFTSRKWKILELKENSSYKHTLLLDSRQDKKGEVKVAPSAL